MKDKKTKLKTIFDIGVSSLIAGTIGYFIYNTVDLNQTITQKNEENKGLRNEKGELETKNVKLNEAIDTKTKEIERTNRFTSITANQNDLLWNNIETLLNPQTNQSEKNKILEQCKKIMKCRF